jgi:hypothetical protein
MAADMAVDFNDAGVDVAAVSIWMGSLTSERLLEMMAAAPEKFKHLEGTLESTGYTGHIAWAMFNDSDMMALSGKTLIGAEIGQQYGITDIDDKYPPSVRHLQHCAPREQYPYKIK